MTATRRPRPRPIPSPRRPYDDDVAYERRWGRLGGDAREREAGRDPLGFVADHLAVTDRVEGCVVVLLDMGDGVRRLVNPVSGAPLDPTATQCRLMLEPFAAAATEVRDPGDVPRLGIVHHRRGPARITALDERWRAALDAVVAEYGLAAIGVAARTEAGALVRVPAASAAA